MRLAIAATLIRQNDLLLAEQIIEEVNEVALSNQTLNNDLSKQIDEMRLSIYNAARRWTSAAAVAVRSGQSLDAVNIEPAKINGADRNRRRARFPLPFPSANEGVSKEDLARFAKGVDGWPLTKPSTKAVDPDRQLQTAFGSTPCTIKDCVGTALQGWSVFVQQASIDLVNPTGQQRLSIPFDNASRGVGPQSPSAYFIDSIVIVELQSELIAIDSLRADDSISGFNSVVNPVLWRESFGRTGSEESPFMGQSRTRTSSEKTSWGSERVKNRKGFVVGPVSRKGVFVAWDNMIACFDPRTGTRRWTRNGIGNLPTIAVDRNRLAVLDHVKSERLILDLRDGRLESTLPWKDEFDVWTTCGPNVLSTFVDKQSTKAILFKLWNAFDGKTVLERSFASDVRAEAINKGDDGYDLAGIMVAWQSNGDFVHWNLLNGKESTQTIAQSASIRSISLERFGNTVLVLTYGPSLKLEMTQEEDDRFRKISGPMFAISNDDGKPLWEAPILVHDYRFPIVQIRSTPAVTLVRPLKYKATIPLPIETGSAAIVDIRNGNLLYSNNYLYSARGQEFQTRSTPGTASLAIQYRGTELQLKWQDASENNNTAEANEELSLPEQIGKIDRNSLQLGTPRELLERLQSGSSSPRPPDADDLFSDPNAK